MTLGAVDERTVEQLTLVVNGEPVSLANVPHRLLLSDCLRHDLGLTGTHVGCEHGVCGACTVLMNGTAVRSCLTLAVQAAGAEIVTIEGVENAEGDELHPIQQAFREEHALQCGFCTPGFVMSVYGYFSQYGPPDADEEIRHMLAGNLCRCTGYRPILAAARRAAAAAREESERPPS